MTFLIVSGTGTEVGKTVVTAAIAANHTRAGRRVVVVKPVQTGVTPSEPGDLQVVQRLTDIEAVVEFARYPDPLAPAAAARISEQPTLDLKSRVSDLHALAHDYDLVLIEGAGGLLVRFDDVPTTLADLAQWLDAPVLIVVHASLGTLNHTELTVRYMDSQGIASCGAVIGAWPTRPDLAARSNLRDLKAVVGQPLRGAVPAGAGGLARDAFAATAMMSLDRTLGGTFDAADFQRLHDPLPTDSTSPKVRP